MPAGGLAEPRTEPPQPVLGAVERAEVAGRFLPATVSLLEAFARADQGVALTAGAAQASGDTTARIAAARMLESRLLELSTASGLLDASVSAVASGPSEVRDVRPSLLGGVVVSFYVEGSDAEFVAADVAMACGASAGSEARPSPVSGGTVCFDMSSPPPESAPLAATSVVDVAMAGAHQELERAVQFDTVALWRQELVRELQRDPPSDLREFLERVPHPPEWHAILGEVLSSPEGRRRPNFAGAAAPQRARRRRGP